MGGAVVTMVWELGASLRRPPDLNNPEVHFNLTVDAEGGGGAGPFGFGGGRRRVTYCLGAASLPEASNWKLALSGRLAMAELESALSGDGIPTATAAFAIAAAADDEIDGGDDAAARKRADDDGTRAAGGAIIAAGAAQSPAGSRTPTASARYAVAQDGAYDGDGDDGGSPLIGERRAGEVRERASSLLC